MKIIEDIGYSIDDIIDRINDELGFSYVRTSDTEGYFSFGQNIELDLEFNPDERKVDKATMKFPEKEIDITLSSSPIEFYSTAIEAASQVMEIVKMMTGKGLEDEDTK